MSATDLTLDELDAFLRVMYPMTWECTTEEHRQARRNVHRSAVAAAIEQARRNDAAARSQLAEWKDGYRDGLTAARGLVETASEMDAGQDKAETLALLDAMITSQVIA